MKLHEARAHPWHGVPIGDDAPRRVTAYIELVPTDTVKYEMDKATGILRVDRPQQYSNVCPSLYGFLPRTLCAERVGALCAERTGRAGIVGDGDPLDVCVLTEKDIPHGDILLKAIPIGGLRMIDGNQADDKIVAVLEGDAVFGGYSELAQCPSGLVDRLRHYFLTYKQGPPREDRVLVPSPGDRGPDGAQRVVQIAHVYDREEAYEVIRRSQEDYHAHRQALLRAADEALED